jgi:predicted NBD/HSP70 family sugar kinase/transcriptional regulator with XRE-family HTH domain
MTRHVDKNAADQPTDHKEDKQDALSAESGDAAADAVRASVLGEPAARFAYDAVVARIDFIEQCRSLRKRLKLSQKQVADLMGTTQSAVSDLEGSRVEPQLQTLQRYALALGGRLELAMTIDNEPLEPQPALRPILQERATGSILMNLYSEGRVTAGAMAIATAWPLDVVQLILSILQDAGLANEGVTGNERAYSLNKAAGRIVGVFLRRDCVLAVLQDLNAEVLDTRSASPADGRRETIVALAGQLIAELLSVPISGVIFGVGVTLAGVVDSDTGVVKFAPDTQNDNDDWHDVPLKELLTADLRARLSPELPVTIENDANALAAHEYLHRLGKWVVAVVLSGGGVGVGVVVQSRGLAEIYHGAHFRAGEGGHTIIDPKNGPPCRAGFPHKGCLETVASAEGILDHLGIPVTSERTLEDGLAEANRRVATRDLKAAKAFTDAGLYFGRFLVAAQAFLDPDLVVIAAHKEIALENYPAGAAFRAGVKSAMSQSSLGEEVELTHSQVKVYWESVQPQTYAKAAGSAAWRYLLTHTDEVKPPISQVVSQRRELLRA